MTTYFDIIPNDLVELIYKKKNEMEQKEENMKKFNKVLKDILPKKYMWYDCEGECIGLWYRNGENPMWDEDMIDEIKEDENLNWEYKEFDDGSYECLEELTYYDRQVGFYKYDGDSDWWYEEI